MKRFFIYAIVFVIGASFWSCKEDDLSSISIIIDDEREMSDFDNWIKREFNTPYNVEIIYRQKDIETTQNQQVTPARISSSKIMSVLLKHLWIDVYNEATGGPEFMRENAVRIMHLIGSGAFNSDGTTTLATAEAGKKITLYAVNGLQLNDPTVLTTEYLLREKGYFQTIHHEFAHIFHQNKDIPTSYKQITLTDYVMSTWYLYDLQEALDLGFISPYSMNTEFEDFVEMYSMYVTMTAADWNARVNKASATGKAKINEKLELVRGYIKSSWGMDMDKLRAIILRRAEEAPQLDFVNLK